MSEISELNAGWGRGARLVSAGHYQPARVVTNDEIAELVDTNDEWIRQRVGIETRRFAGDETVPDLATFAARDAIDKGGIDASDVDLIIVATCSNMERSPSTAGRVAEALGVAGIPAFDVNAACSGFVHALETAKALITSGSARTAVVVGAERMTDVTDWTDRSTCILIGDGAGAVVLQAAEQSTLSPVVWGTVPGLASAVRIDADTGKFAQDGRAVFRWAITEAGGHARRVLDVAGVTAGELGGFVPHQANLRIIEPLAQQLGIDPAVTSTDIRDSGNTSAASIPIALSKMLAAGTVASGAPVLLFGFGGGFSYAGLVVSAP